MRLLVFALLLALAGPAAAVTINVTNANSSGPGSLRQAVIHTNAPQYPLLAGSAAIDIGSCSGIYPDQNNRPQYGARDLGAFEVWP